MIFRLFLTFLVVVLIASLSILTGAKYSCKISSYLKQNFLHSCCKCDNTENVNNETEPANNAQSGDAQTQTPPQNATENNITTNTDPSSVNNGGKK